MEHLAGHWMIQECRPSSATEDKKGLEGTSFVLSNGSVRWHVPDNTADVPLLHCDTCDVIFISNGPDLWQNVHLRFGTHRGHLIDFIVAHHKLSFNELILTKGKLVISCKNIALPAALPPFSFLPALEDGYFADLELVAANSKIFRVHTCILSLSAPDFDWTATPPPWTGFPEEVLGTVLHFLYAQCLPAGLPEKTAEDVVNYLADIPQLDSLRTLCQCYLTHLTIKQRILQLVGEIHCCALKITERFQQRGAVSDPPKLWDAFKLSVRDLAVAYAKLVLVISLYQENKGQLTQGADQEIIRYLQSRGHIWLRQIKVFLATLTSLLNNLDDAQRLDLARYLVPEVEVLMDTTLRILHMVWTAALVLKRQCVKEGDDVQTRIIMSPFQQCINEFIADRETRSFDRFHTFLIRAQDLLRKKKRHFKGSGNNRKMMTLACGINGMIEELPLLNHWLEELIGDGDLETEWYESHFCFKVGTSLTCDMLKRLVNDKDREGIRSLLLELSRLVARDEFTHILVELQLLDETDYVHVGPTLEDNQNVPLSAANYGYMPNLTEGLCVSPGADAVNNGLPQAAGKLLTSQWGTDMVFEVVEGADGGEVSEIPAHRVVVAARCDWFRRALLSGMQEDINRRIEVHNCSANIFQKFLEYLYTGKLVLNAFTCTELIEILIVADCYEVDTLKAACEKELALHLKHGNIVELLHLADQLNAPTLKDECISYINDYPDVMDQTGFLELSMSLQACVYDAIRISPISCIFLGPRKKKPENETRSEPEGEEGPSSL